MTGTGYIRLGATMLLMLALMTPGDATRASSAPGTQKARVRLILDTNFGDAFARQYERLLPNVRVEVVTAVGSVPTVAASGPPGRSRLSQPRGGDLTENPFRSIPMWRSCRQALQSPLARAECREAIQANSQDRTGLPSARRHE